ncbi:hypothetical protein [Microcoleus sp. FACHB-68]|uniref:hypothetical protein n=1 Tax=Microcoleus sp. FACHB-68 TaxID=2692826 RepID=UPI0016849A7D|nr:hypothetical protein [Microcoleus sp. FACHB-68]MBD1938374.1 hypothetical protein [Microcoleus sp. FACHB-68]
MKTLITLFDKERSELQRDIDKAGSLDQVVKLVQNRLDNLEKSYMGDLNVTQIRLASFFLETLRQSVAALSAANEVKFSVPPTSSISNSTAKLAPNKLILKVLQVLAGAGTLTSLISLMPNDPQVWMPTLLVSVVIGLEVALKLDKKTSENNSTVPLLPETTLPVVRVDSQILLGNLADALNTIDQAVARATDVQRNPESNGLEELPELLTLIQRLWGASVLNKPQMAIELTKMLPQVLMEEGIRAQIYQPHEAKNSREYFDFEPSIDPATKDCVTITPALFKGDSLLRRGRVIEPANLTLPQSDRYNETVR